ncbi:Di, tripeptide permease DtpT [Fructilactobacillus florum 8D]|uniref:Di-/tripeptide transporter n=1 Tax=Fructilactobacillus florum 8D TaxID=1221538 RepID=W9EEJ9_9LACO|nr:peptide MFS transporter [Fructilactobacillus florum]EKK21069.1 Di, tripeptide permease DtpT [Fructilactobacillus florum 2F]ETO40553.1 Di, tripeptide permease DtpT [Fructilactobacillus florum 8D]
MGHKKDSDHAFFGQPQGLMYLAGTEFWERFSYYGMRAILLYYMLATAANGGLGLAKTTGLSIMAIYGALVYLATITGGYISDRILGSRRTVFSGGVMIMFGHIALSLPFGLWGLLMSIVLITTGTGLLKPNISNMVGNLYSTDDQRSESAFTIFTFAINFGAFIAPLICGWTSTNYNYHVGFSLAAVGMLIGLIFYYIGGKKHLGEIGLHPTDPIRPRELKTILFRMCAGLFAFVLILLVMAGFRILSLDSFVSLLSLIAVITPVWYFIMMLRSKKITAIERSRVLAYIPLFIGALIFWAIEESGSSILASFAQSQTNNDLGWLHIDPSWYQSLNPLFIMLYTPLFVWLWTKLGKRQPSTPRKFALGIFFAGLSFLFMVIPLLLFGSDAKINPLWLVGSWAIIEIGEMLISPIGLSVTTKLAPKAFGSQMLGMWFLADAAGQAVNSQIARFYQPGTEIAYFGIIGIIAIIASLILLFFVKPILKLMDGVE